uniref:EKC/KEOPS complex subunit LAGE3 n=1 Tax=Castor canadensis TaxID=51338 RepID=A0A8C0ZRG0_CASCN
MACLGHHPLKRPTRAGGGSPASRGTLFPPGPCSGRPRGRGARGACATCGARAPASPACPAPPGPFRCEAQAVRMGLFLSCFSVSTLRVPFLAPIQAEIARRSLDPYQEHPSVHRELTVNGSFLVVSRWEAPKCQISLTSFLNHLSQLLQTMQRFGPLSVPVSLLGKGG